MSVQDLLMEAARRLQSLDRRVARLEVQESGAGGITDHGALDGLGDDDHPQYQQKDSSGNVTVSGDTRIGGGLYVGGTDVDPAEGVIGLAEIATPAKPPANSLWLYAKSDGLAWKDDSGIEHKCEDPNRHIEGWVRFNGTGAVAIGDHYNVSSITDNGVGDYTVNWAVDFASNTYAVCACSNAQETLVSAAPAGSARVVTCNSGGTKQDVGLISVIAVGDR